MIEVLIENIIPFMEVQSDDTVSVEWKFKI